MSKKNKKDDSNDEYKKSVGKRIEELRIALGYTQEKFSEALGIGEEGYREYVKGRTMPRLDFFVELKRKFPNHTNIDYIVTGDKGVDADIDINDMDSIIRYLKYLIAIYEQNKKNEKENRKDNKK